MFALAEDLAWMDHGLCVQVGPEAHYPEKGDPTTVAKRVCLGCPVRAECLDYALRHDERYGVWGGLSTRERRKLRRPTSAPAPTVDLCRRGLHAMDGVNVQRRRDGYRRCLACRREKDAVRRAVRGSRTKAA